MTRKDRAYFRLGEDGSGCHFDTRASDGDGGGLQHRPLRLLEGGGEQVKGGEPIINKIRNQYLCQSQNPLASQRKTRAPKSTSSPDVKGSPALNRQVKSTTEG